MTPRISILDKAFVYRNADNSDIRKTFAAYRAQQATQPKTSVVKLHKGKP